MTTAPQQRSVAVLYSGGTDSTCTAALMAEQHSDIHLLTFYELGTRTSPSPTGNVEALAARFPRVRFHTRLISVDRLVRYLSYNRYLHYLVRYRWLVLANTGFSSLSWHVRTLVYCLEHGITEAVDGVTRELMHFPGHMDEVIELFAQLYLDFGIHYHNPVRAWDTPPDQQFVDRMIVNTHGGEFSFGAENPAVHKTTGQYLFNLGVFPAPNVKGSRLDFAMQHDCYPFALYNILAFWGMLSFQSYPVFCRRLAALVHDKICDMKVLIEEYRINPRQCRMAGLLEGT